MTKRKYDLYAIVIKFCGNKYRSTWFSDRDKAIDYFDRMPGVIAVEKIGDGIIFEKLPQYKAEHLLAHS